MFLWPVVLSAGLDRIEPQVCKEFGKVTHIEGEFIEKNNDYHSQNIAREAYSLKVLSVDGIKLDKPIIIEYVRDFEAEVNPGKIYKLLCFETSYTIGDPTGWYDYSSQVNYRVVNFLVIKPMEEGLRSHGR